MEHDIVRAEGAGEDWRGKIRITDLIPGLHFEIPCVEHAEVVDMRTSFMKVPPQEVRRTESRSRSRSSLQWSFHASQLSLLGLSDNEHHSFLHRRHTSDVSINNQQASITAVTNWHSCKFQVMERSTDGLYSQSEAINLKKEKSGLSLGIALKSHRPA